jgi:hypothetical protein
MSHNAFRFAHSPIGSYNPRLRVIAGAANCHWSPCSLFDPPEAGERKSGDVPACERASDRDIPRPCAARMAATGSRPVCCSGMVAAQ